MKIIDTVNELISNNEFKHRRHPGIIKLKRVEQPSWLIKTIKNILHGNKL